MNGCTLQWPIDVLWPSLVTKPWILSRGMANTCLYEIYSCIEIQVCYNVMNILVLRHPWFFELDILVSTAALLSPKSDGRKTVNERSGTSSDQCSKPSVLPFYCTGWWIGFPIHVLSFNPFFASVKSQQKCRLNPTSEVSTPLPQKPPPPEGIQHSSLQTAMECCGQLDNAAYIFGTIWSFQKMLKKTRHFSAAKFFLIDFRRYARSQTVPENIPGTLFHQATRWIVENTSRAGKAPSKPPWRPAQIHSVWSSVVPNRDLRSPAVCICTGRDAWSIVKSKKLQGLPTYCLSFNARHC